MNTQYDEIIISALKEDIGSGDVTTLSTVPKEQNISGKFIVKENGVICGLEICARVFEILDDRIVFSPFIKDGDRVLKGDVIAEISGPAQGILSGERTALNFLQRLSGIATKTAYYADILKDTKTKIYDTRKTTPGLRNLEKYAVRTGGGVNHRLNLSDMVLIKDNHIKAAGSILKAVNSIRSNSTYKSKIEVETENFEQIEEALKAKVDIIMLDNMSLEDMKTAVKMIDGRALVEASGNMEDKNLLDIAKTGVDIISMGGLTHSVRALDISLKF